MTLTGGPGRAVVAQDPSVALGDMLRTRPTCGHSAYWGLRLSFNSFEDGPLFTDRLEKEFRPSQCEALKIPRMSRASPCARRHVRVGGTQVCSQEEEV